MVIKMPNKLQRRIGKLSENLNKETGKTEPIRTEVHNNWNEKYTRGKQNHIRWCINIPQGARTQGSENHPLRTAKRNKIFFLMNIV